MEKLSHSDSISCCHFRHFAKPVLCFAPEGSSSCLIMHLAVSGTEASYDSTGAGFLC